MDRNQIEEGKTYTGDGPPRTVKRIRDHRSHMMVDFSEPEVSSWSCVSIQSFANWATGTVE